MSKKSHFAGGVGVLAAAFVGQVAWAQVTLPAQISWTAYDVGSAGYNQAVAIGSALKNELKVDLRVLPGKNDVSRQVPLRGKQVQFSATGVGASYLAQEGVLDFGAKSWGPQEVRVLLTANADSNLTVGVAADLGIKTFADLRGKRVAYIVGSPSLNENVTAILSFANLTWDDVKRVDFPGFGQSWDGIINNQVDAAFATTTSGKAYQLEASPRGIFWPPLPHNDKEGWKRLQDKAPFFAPNVATEGAGLSKEKPNEGAAYPYPILISYADQNADLVYNMTKAMVTLYPKYQGTAPGINGWALERQRFEWAVPYHDGAIRYFKEIGKWTDAHQKHNDNLVKRQQILKAAWAEAVASKVADDQFTKNWMALRAKRLEAAGMPVIYR